MNTWRRLLSVLVLFLSVHAFGTPPSSSDSSAAQGGGGEVNSARSTGPPLHMRGALAGDYLQFRDPAVAQQSWNNLAAAIELNYEPRRWIFGADGELSIRTLGRSGTNQDLKKISAGGSVGRKLHLGGAWSLDVALGARYLKFLTTDQNTGISDLLLVELTIALERRAPKQWLRIALRGGPGNSDARIVDFHSGNVQLAVDHSPRFLRPFYWGFRVALGSFQLGDVTYHVLDSQLRLGVGF